MPQGERNRQLLLDVRDAVGFSAAFGVSRETTERVAIYIDTLRLWQKAVNLVAPGSIDHVWQRHVADSAQIYALAPADALRWVDLGSGAGFPGLLLALLLVDRPQSQVILVESDARKCAFLRDVVRKTGIAQLLSVDILMGRIESPEIQAKVGAVDVVTARALAPLDGLLALVAPYFRPGTVGLFPKGRDFRHEVEVAQRNWAFDVSCVSSRTEPGASIVVVRQLARLN